MVGEPMTVIAVRIPDGLLPELREGRGAYCSRVELREIPATRELQASLGPEIYELYLEPPEKARSGDEDELSAERLLVTDTRIGELLGAILPHVRQPSAIERAFDAVDEILERADDLIASGRLARHVAALRSQAGAARKAMDAEPDPGPAIRGGRIESESPHDGGRR